MPIKPEIEPCPNGLFRTPRLPEHSDYRSNPRIIGTLSESSACQINLTLTDWSANYNLWEVVCRDIFDMILRDAYMTIEEHFQRPVKFGLVGEFVSRFLSLFCGKHPTSFARYVDQRQ